MKKIVFLTDIDNTLIYSYKHKEKDDVCVEYIKDKEQGFMRPTIFNYWKKLSESVDIVTITTRSIEQYKRINWPQAINPKYSITTNGAYLIEGENISRLLDVQDAEMCEVYRLYHKFQDDERFIRCRVVDDAYLFVYCNNEVDPFQLVEEFKEQTKLEVYCYGKKIYFLPRNNTKEKAIQKWLSTQNYDIVIGAGDSVLDIGIINNSNYGIIPKKMDNVIVDKLFISENEHEFSDNIVYSLKEILSTNGQREN